MRPQQCWLPISRRRLRRARPSKRLREPRALNRPEPIRTSNLPADRIKDRHMKSLQRWMAAGVLLCAHVSANAQGFLGADQGKLLLTAGFSTLEGAGGGALTPFAMIAGYGSNRSWG